MPVPSPQELGCNSRRIACRRFRKYQKQVVHGSDVIHENGNDNSCVTLSLQLQQRSAATHGQAPRAHRSSHQGDFAQPSSLSATSTPHPVSAPQGDRRVKSHVLPHPMPLIPPRLVGEQGVRGSTPSVTASQDGVKQRWRLSQQQRASADEVLEMLRLDKSPPRAPPTPPPPAPCPGEVPVAKSSTGDHKVNPVLKLQTSVLNRCARSLQHPHSLQPHTRYRICLVIASNTLIAMMMICERMQLSCFCPRQTVICCSLLTALQFGKGGGSSSECEVCARLLLVHKHGGCYNRCSCL